MIPIPLAAAGTALKTLFSGWKVYAIIGAIVLVIVAAFTTYHWIYDSAYQDGINDTTKIYQPQIDKFNTEAAIRNAKIADLEKAAAKQAFDLITLTQKVQDLSLSSIEFFTKQFPEVAKECGVKPQTTSTYNEFLTKALFSK